MFYAALSQAPDPLQTESKLRELLDQALTFIYTSAHWLGGLMAEAIEASLSYTLPDDLIDPLGFLMIITIFLIVASVAKKLAWYMIIAGWILILLRIVIEIFEK